MHSTRPNPARTFLLHAACWTLLCATASGGWGLAAEGAADAPASAAALFPGTSYDPDVPTIEGVLGYRPGEHIASHAELTRYFEQLAAAEPERLRLSTYGSTWEGRKLIYAAIGNAENIARLDAIRGGMQELADPRVTDPQRAAQLFDQLPALVWFAYGVHGNEVSSPDAAMFFAYHLLAAQGDPTVDAILADAVVLLDPLQNPDGRDRFVQTYRASYGIEPDADRLAAEHDEPWPQGRTNHYLFDLNRDWFALTQVETRAKVALLQQWYPLVFVDLHEMGGDSTYYFAPAAEPYNPNITRDQRKSLELFGRNNARSFDARGFDYFVSEVYDAFYPGYGDSWPASYGAVSMTFEQASPRGLLWLRSDGDQLTFREAMRHHLVASLATAETAAHNRRKLLSDFYDYRSSAIEEGRTEAIRTIALPRQGDRAAVDKLAGLLALQGIEVLRSKGLAHLCGADLPAGSYAIDLAQPAKRLIRNLLDPDIPLDADFLAQQEHRRQRGLPDQIYDVTAWSLPLMFGIEARTCNQPIPNDDFELDPPRLVQPGAVHHRGAKVAYLAAWSSQAAGRLLARALRRGLRVWSSDGTFLLNGKQYPAGSLIFKLHDNPPDLEQQLAELAADTGAIVEGTDSSWVDQGPSFGSEQVFRLRAPRVALAWDTPTSPSAAGAMRFVLERQFGYPVSVIRTERMARADLHDYQVVILPDGRYTGKLDDEAIQRLADWVNNGGTLVAIADAMVPFSGEEASLFSTELETFGQSGAKGESQQLVLEDALAYHVAIRPESAKDPEAGALLRADLDQDHWLAAGASPQVHVLYSGTNVFRPLTLDHGVNVAVYAGPDQVLASGHLWQENAERLAYKPLLMIEPHGRGLAIGFTTDPTRRAYQEGLNLLLLNAVFRGPAHAER